MLARLILFGLIAARAVASPVIHSRSAAEHRDVLRRELRVAFVDIADGYTLDAALVRLQSVNVGNDVEIRAELRGLLSEPNGRIRFSAMTRATARGRARDRGSLERDAIAAVSAQLAHVLNARCSAVAMESRPRRRRN